MQPVAWLANPIRQISTIPTQQHPTGYIVSNADDLLEIFDADSGLLVIGDGCKLLGK